MENKMEWLMWEQRTLDDQTIVTKIPTGFLYVGQSYAQEIVFDHNNI